jgi:chloramphenicol O-acetyltransferase type B
MFDLRRARRLVTQLIRERSLTSLHRGKIADPRVQIGKHSYGIERSSIKLFSPGDRVIIGKYCSVAAGVRFVCGEHSTSRVTTFPLRTLLFNETPENRDAISKGPIVVGNDVWIGTNAVILSGVTVGHGAVIGAGAVITRDVPPYAVVGGVPAKVIKMRFRPDQIESLLDIAWWDWPEERLRANRTLFYGDIDAFIDAHYAAGTPIDSPSTSVDAALKNRNNCVGHR